MNQSKKKMVIDEKNGFLLIFAAYSNLMIIVGAVDTKWELYLKGFVILMVIAISAIDLWLWTKEDTVLYNCLFNASCLGSIESIILVSIYENIVGVDLTMELFCLVIMIVSSIFAIKKGVIFSHWIVENNVSDLLKEKKPTPSLFQLLGLSGAFMVAVAVRFMRRNLDTHHLLRFLCMIIAHAALSFAISYYVSSIFYWKNNRELLEVERFDSVMSEEDNAQNQD